MVREVDPISEDISPGTASPDPEATFEALIAAHNNLPRDTDLGVGDLLQWDGDSLVKVDVSAAAEGDLLTVQADGTVAPQSGAFRATKGAGEGVVVSGSSITHQSRHPIMNYTAGANNFASWTFDVRDAAAVSVAIRYINLGTDTTNAVRWRADLQGAVDGTALSTPSAGSSVDQVPAAQHEEDAVELNASFDVSSADRLTVVVTRQGTGDSNTGAQGILEVIVEDAA